MVQPDQQERIELVRKHLAYLRARSENLESHWQATPKLFWFALLAVPATIFKGLLMGVLMVVFAFVLVGTAAYLRGVRRADCKIEIAALQAQLADLEQKK